MNHIYRVVFNHALGVMQAIAETGKANAGSQAGAGQTATGRIGNPARERADSLFRKQRIAQIVALATALFAQGYAHAASSNIVLSANSTTSQNLAANGSVTVNSGVTLNVSDGSNSIAAKGTGTITNNGTITETLTGDNAGRAIRDKSDPLSLTVINNAGAVISAADNDAIQIQYADNNVAITNYGKIISYNASIGGAQAIDFNKIMTGANSVYNGVTGLIQAYEADAVRPGVNGTIDNAGTIYSYNSVGTVATSDGPVQIALSDSSDGIDAQNNSGVAVTNEATGVIEGGRHGITGGADPAGDGTFTLSVTNAKGGVIKGDDGSGINIDGFNAKEVVTVKNAGTITGNGNADGLNDGKGSDGDGVDVDGLVNLTNSGTIQSLHAYNDTSEGVTVGGGTIVNTGTIAGYNSATNSDGTANSGLGRGITLAGLDKDPVTSAAIPTQGIYANTSVDNSGLIYGSSAGAIAVTGAANAFTVSITNEATGTLEGGGSEAVVSTGGNASTVTNYGTIKADGTGKAIDLGSGNSTVSILGSVASVTGDMSGGTGTSTLTMTPGSGNAFTYNGAISNFSAVNVGAGTVSLSGTNTYSGATTVASGATLALTGTGSLAQSAVTANGALDISGTTAGTSIASLAGSGTVNLGGQTLTLTNASGVFSGSISGTGGLTLVSGTQTLTGVSTYTGTTLIQTGATLILSDSGDIILANVVNNGTLQVQGTLGNLSGTGTVTVGSGGATLSGGSFGGTVAGSGAVTVTGNQTLSGANTYTGATSISSGATLALTGSGSIAASSSVTNAGALDISGTTSGASITTLSGNGTVALGSKTLTLSNAAGTYSGAISGTGGVSVTGGKETLTTASTYTGGTSVATGATLALTGSGSIAASSGVTTNGTLDISGTTSGATVQNLSGSGTVALGAQKLTLANASGTYAGAFTGSGSIVKQGTGSLILDGNSSGYTGTTEVSAGLLEVGDADNASAVLGGTANVDAAGTLRGHGTVAGSVNNSGTVQPGGSIGTLTVGGNYAQASTATLAIEVSPTAASQLAVNGKATLNGVLAITYDPGTYSAHTYTLVTAAGGVSGTFSSVTSSGTANIGTLTQAVSYGANNVQLVLSGTGTGTTVVAPNNTSIYTAAGTSAILASQAESAALLGRLANAGAGASAGNPAGWITATGIQTKVGGSNGAPGFQADRYGFLAGLEHQVGAYTTGIAVGYDHTDIDESNTGDSGTTDALRAALYGGRAYGPVNLGATLGVGVDFMSQKRPFGAVGTAEGDHSGEEFNLGGQASLPMTLGSFTVTPSVGLRYAYFHADAFSESGAGGQDLAVGTDNVRSLQPYVGVTVDRAFGDALRPVNAQLRLGYAHELLDANRAMSVAASDGTLFTAPGTSLPRGYFTAGAGVTLHPKKNLSVSLSYDALINTTHASAQQGQVRVGYQF
ncbi:autotransporter domain-containing protein [Paraburkholderia acidisoli]|uniref:Autotransporter domain-containing protein n=1 Tax=Paraburkholderia acidisoli TaxID=2571748 RepID=A0A7Z2GR89_9BURK|nr:autotransporter domain-containing protein [Paraburkholderia acidisoli]QGZ66420.1 autotransporter domain-containing protein [Paraburkholderia acidisoli]